MFGQNMCVPCPVQLAGYIFVNRGEKHLVPEISRKSEFVAEILKMGGNFINVFPD